MPQLKLYLLGSPRVELNHKAIDLPRRRVVAILVYLAMTRQIHRRDALASIFWPDSGQTVARTGVRRELHALNSTLGDEWLESTHGEIGLHTDADIWVDVEEFRKEVATCSTHGHDPSELCSQCQATLTRAAALYRGDFLEGFLLTESPDFTEWQRTQTENLHREFAAVLEKLIQLHEEQAGYEAAIDYARCWLLLDLMHEPGHRRLMHLYALGGQGCSVLVPPDLTGSGSSSIVGDISF